MKKYLILILCLIFLSASTSFALVGGGHLSTCSTSNDTEIYVPVDQDDVDTAPGTIVCNKVVFADQKTITAYLPSVCDNNSDTGDFNMLLYDHDDGNDQPDETSLVADSTKNTLASAITDCGTPSPYEVVLATPLVIASGTYWVCRVEENSADILVYIDSSSTGDRYSKSSDGGLNWTSYDNQGLNMEVWGCN